MLARIASHGFSPIFALQFYFPPALRIECSISKLRGFCGLGSLFEGQQTTFGTIEYNNALQTDKEAKRKVLL